MGTSTWSNINPRTGSRASSAKNLPDGSGSPLPVMSLGITYILLVPLLIFAVHGGFSFEHASWNSDLGAVGGKFVIVPTSADALRDRLQSAIALAVCLLAMLPFYRRILSVCLRMPLMILMPVYATTSALWSQDAGLSLRSGVSLILTTLFAFYLATGFSERQQMELVIVTGVCVVAVSIALALFWPRFGIDHQLHKGAWQGMFTQKNVCAGVTLFLLTPALAISPRGRYALALRAVYTAFCLLLIFMTQSRTGWAITAIYLLFMCGLRMLGKFSRKDLLPLIGVMFSLIAGAVVVAMQYPLPFLSILSRSESISGRSQIWSAIVASILRHPIGGYGFDAFWSLLHGEASNIFASTGWVVTGAHNGFLNVGLELGLVGLVLVAATFVRAFCDAGIAFHPGRSTYVDWCVGIVFLTLIYNLDERTIMATQYLLWILYIIACVGLARAATERAFETRREAPP
jgi:exopolysaccharide production protein ExoQ